MNDIICPQCKKVFKVDEAGFADILKQVRDHVFDKELHERLELAEKEKENAIKLAKVDVEKLMQADIAKKDKELATLKAEKESAVKLAEANIKSELQADIVKRDAEIAELKAEKDALLAKTLAEKEAEMAKIQAKLEFAEADKNAEIAKLQSKLEAADTDKKLAVTEAVSKVEKERDELGAKLESSVTEKELAVSKAVNIVEKERDELASKLEIKDHEQKALEFSLKEKHEVELKLKDEQIAQYKDFKSRQSVKLLGENLEQHCNIVFRQWQSAGAFRNVYFEKDNDASTGGKGDYIYRETDEAGNEIMSIMFDMKNESDDTATKKKNEDYFKKLDRDRIEKKCQYAVLVSVLEADSELYAGITDVSYAYDKMYVVRPQFFIPIITLLRNSALDSLKYKAELALVRDQNIDITNFENDLQLFQEGFMRNIKDSSNKFRDAMDGIDATIKKLEGIKEALRLSNKHLLTAGNKVENVSVKRLTKNNPTMAAKFEELSSKSKA